MTGYWTCHIKTRDDSLHKVDWEDTQIRKFQWKLTDRFLEETALFPAKQKNDTTVFGLHLMSYDEKKGKWLQSGYWANKAGRTFDAEGTIAADGKSLYGIMHLYKPDNTIEKNRLEIIWVNENQFEYKVHKTDKRGQEFILEELVYRRV